jgi:hypothetical protein
LPRIARLAAVTAAAIATAAGADRASAHIDDDVAIFQLHAFVDASRQELRIGRLAPIRAQDDAPAGNLFVFGLGSINSAVANPKDERWLGGATVDANDVDETLFVLRRQFVGCTMAAGGDGK